MKKAATYLILLCALTLGSFAAQWESCEQWASKAYGKYTFRNNTWGTSQPGYQWQCAWANSSNNWGGDCGHVNSTGMVKGYLQMITGWVHVNGFDLNPNNRGNLGKQIASYSALTCKWHFTAPNSGTARYISLIDVYTHTSSNPAGSVLPRTNVQIYTQLRDPSNWLNDNISGTYVGQKTIGSVTYKMWFKDPHPDGSNAAQRLVHIRPTSWQSAATHNIKGIIQWAIDKGKMSSSEYVTSIQAGWEFIDGANGADFTTTAYAVNAASN